MDVQNLRDNYPKLMSYMEENGYSKTYVDRLKREVKKILSTVDSKEWSGYTDVYLEYTKTSNSPDYLREKRTVIGAIEQFEVYGRYPNGRRRHELFKRGAYPLLSPEFKSVIDCYGEVERKRGKKTSTVYTESHNASTFLLALQQKGMDSLDRITEEAVLAVFMSSDGKLRRSCSYKKNVAAVFKAFLFHLEMAYKICMKPYKSWFIYILDSFLKSPPYRVVINKAIFHYVCSSSSELIFTFTNVLIRQLLFQITNILL